MIIIIMYTYVYGNNKKYLMGKNNNRTSILSSLIGRQGKKKLGKWACFINEQINIALKYVWGAPK